MDNNYNTVKLQLLESDKEDIANRVLEAYAKRNLLELPQHACICGRKWIAETGYTIYDGPNDHIRWLCCKEHLRYYIDPSTARFTVEGDNQDG